MQRLKAAEEMYQYCVDNDLGVGDGKEWAIESFKTLIWEMEPDEEIYFVFPGRYICEGLTIDRSCAIAVTSKRIISVEVTPSGDWSSRIVKHEHIHDDVTLERKMIAEGCFHIGYIHVSDAFCYSVDISLADNIYKRLHEVLDMIREQKLQEE